MNLRNYPIIGFVLILVTSVYSVQGQRDTICPPQELILPCRCSQKNAEIQIWCSHSDLPRVLAGIKRVAKAVNRPIDELILENNYLPSLPGRAFSQLQISRLMLRHNGLERLSSGWLTDLEASLVEIFIVERELRSVPVDSLYGLRNLEAITIQSDSLKRCPDFTGLQKLRYISIESASLIELSPVGFRDLHSLETIAITGSDRLNRLEAGLFLDLPKLKTLNLQGNGVEFIHLRAFSGLPSLEKLHLDHNKISNAAMVGRAIKDLPGLQKLYLDVNMITVLAEGSFVDLSSLRELYLNDNMIAEILHGAFHRTPQLKLVHLQNNALKHVHPESFLQSSGSGVEIIHLQHNEIARVEELRSLLDALPMLRYLDLSFNHLEEIPFGALRGHGTLEQLHINHNGIRIIERDAFMAMPSLRELRLKNNSLTDLLPMPFWNLPGLKGLDVSFNQFRRLEPNLLIGLPSLRRFDISENSLSTIDPGTFLNTPMLETVNISHNELSTIHQGTFNHLNHLFELDLSYNNLPEVINGLPRAIERLNLKKNKINDLPTSAKAFELPSLRMLDLSANHLTRIPRLVFTLAPQLRTLSLANNRLQNIDETSLMGLNRLEELNLQDNQISSMHDQSTSSLDNLRELNLEGNKLEVIVDRILEGTPKLEKLDISRNSIHELTPGSFSRARTLQVLDLSSNNLKELPKSLENLESLREMDISFNQIANFNPETMKSFLNLEEFKASNNKIGAIKQGTFHNLPALQYLDLSSNDISVLERGAIRNLPELQEIVLADNRLIDLRDRVFEDLPNLQAIHLQQNNLRGISTNTFYHSPSILYLNLSTNQFRYLENVGLRNVRNLEVLDLSNNELRKISSNPLRGLDWLVELKLNDNRICKIQGEPFSSMPRLRVLSMRNNRMSRIQEASFRNLRGNIAILDVDGNPIECTCDMLWLRAWLQETGGQFPGPRCRDGSMLRDLDLNRQNCGGASGDERAYNQIPLTNEHGDVFLRQSDLYDDCGPGGVGEGYEEFPPGNQFYSNNLPPSPVESEYFYDQYVDYPGNETQSQLGIHNNSVRLNGTNLNQFTDFNNNKFTQYNNNLLPDRPPSSQFTFFGMPIPSLSIGNIWGAGRTANNRASATGNAIAGIGTRGKGRVQIYRPGDPELQVVVNQNENDIEDKKPQASSDRKQTIDTTEKSLNNFYRPYFQTPFSQPPTEKGGFTPMVPGMTSGGFMPVNGPEAQNDTRYWDADDRYQEKVPLVTENSNSRRPTGTVADISKITKRGPVNSDHVVVRNHVTTSISPILSTLTTFTSKSEEQEKSGDFTNKAEVVTETEVPKSLSTFDEITKFESNMRKNFNEEKNSYQSEETGTTQHNMNHIQKINEKIIPTVEEAQEESEEELVDNDDDDYNPLPAPSVPSYIQPNIYAQNSSSSLSALVAPGSIVTEFPQNSLRPPSSSSIPKGKSTITKVFSPSPPPETPEVEIYPRGSPRPAYPFPSSTAYNDFDSEYQPNQIYTQTLNEKESYRTPQYEREDMEWYFKNYNRTDTPILNYNQQSLDINSFRSNSVKFSLSYLILLTGVLLNFFM